MSSPFSMIIKDKGFNRVHFQQPKSGGRQAEVHYFLCGLDIAGKAKLLETEIQVNRAAWPN
ncbi:hypothetical protein CA14_003239 [Aspergillus flavus]|uniref:Uncharacterized protein n=1 Tax=Aspergillus flavus TaxID=5059 RepID=A0AB74BWJ4_ASPFL|nr:hypothetical protein CA14_003239 [Aspergillus flavus]